MAFCAWLNDQAPAELRYTLPSEAQWEFAARGPKGLRYPWGDEEPDETRAWFGKGIEGAPAPVGTHPAGRGPLGHHDLMGNVWEWCLDEYEGLKADEDGIPRVLRGGAFYLDDLGRGAAAVRLGYWSWYRDGFDDVYGFRLAAVPASTA